MNKISVHDFLVDVIHQPQKIENFIGVITISSVSPSDNLYLCNKLTKIGLYSTSGSNRRENLTFSIENEKINIDLSKVGIGFISALSLCDLYGQMVIPIAHKGVACNLFIKAVWNVSKGFYIDNNYQYTKLNKLYDFVYGDSDLEHFTISFTDDTQFRLVREESVRFALLQECKNAHLFSIADYHEDVEHPHNRVERKLILLDNTANALDDNIDLMAKGYEVDASLLENSKELRVLSLLEYLLNAKVIGKVDCFTLSTRRKK